MRGHKGTLQIGGSTSLWAPPVTVLQLHRRGRRWQPRAGRRRPPPRGTAPAAAADPGGAEAAGQERLILLPRVFRHGRQGRE